MLDLRSTEFTLVIPSIPEWDLRRLSSSLFGSWESFVDEAVLVPDYSLALQVEERLVKGLAKIGAAVSVVYLAIGNYGDFVSGATKINEQVKATGQYLARQASRVFSCSPSRAYSRNRGGTLVGLKRLFDRVQSGELTPEEATMRAEKLLGDDADTEPNFMREPAGAFQRYPRHHKQQPFSLLEDG